MSFFLGINRASQLQMEGPHCLLKQQYNTFVVTTYLVLSLSLVRDLLYDGNLSKETHYSGKVCCYFSYIDED